MALLGAAAIEKPQLPKVPLEWNQVETRERLVIPIIICVMAV